ncbi:nitroreductase family protein [Mycolicibacterium wolinskyi]|uniref:Nitroreductase domain-containing protein n=1 Tax=Mycolicibacterium wolinskyi TaxID=59750 RepID=A0A1X2FDA4_9MYCO|nr:MULTISPECIES: nitroreductase family protein [Mycolicibacterium]MCV7289315.1 nitroreductase family protein [Mycolicibacterium wolinskyi]MCV7294342.1 nitroreductase family protein [Mycolicibacterium goodii]ORX16384.1 hypothetical protein AWC31_20220 [Mycolicibacterium wolinskyi]
MTTGFPDGETVRTAMSLAVRAPSVYDSQPWRWQMGADSLCLYADRTHHLPDTDGRDLLLSCGATLHHCVVALAGRGYQATVHRLPDPADPGLLAALTAGPRVPTDADVTLAAAIGRRHIDRRLYFDREVSLADIALMGARAARAGVTLRRVESFTDLTPIMDVARQISDRGVVVALGTRDDDDLARLRAGEAMSLVLLTATALGLATCPLTEPLKMAQARAALRDEIFDGREHPQMLIRLGWALDDAAALPDTPRRQPA